VARVRFDSGKGGQQRTPDLSIQDSNFRIVQNRAGILGQLLRQSAMRCWRPVTVHAIFANIFMATTVHIPDPLLKSVDRRAKALGISRNRLVIRALEQAVSVRADWSPEFLQRLRTVDRETSTAVDELLTAVTQARRSKEPRDL
jgi:predicted transcriptional regulator